MNNLIHNTLIKFDKPFKNNINLDKFEAFLNSIPKQFYKNLKRITIGNYDFLQEYGLTSYYHSQIIYIDSNILNEEQLYKSIIHEMFHSFSQIIEDSLENDKNLQDEFIRIRKMLYSDLLSNNILDATRHRQYKPYFLSFEYNPMLDNLFYKKIGYDRLGGISGSYLFTPYAITALREYIACGLEEYYLGDYELLKKLSPELVDFISHIPERLKNKNKNPFDYYN